MEYTLISASLLLFLILDPFGNIPLFANALKPYTLRQRLYIIAREHGIAFAILLAFMFGGEVFLKALNLSQTSLQIAGGIVLFLIAIRMIFPHPDADSPDDEQHEPFIVPLAVPLIAGPSSLATVLLFVNQQPNEMATWMIALIIAVLGSCGVLLLATRLANFLGSKFIVAMERLMGLILVAISVEMATRGLRSAFGH